MSSPPSVEIRSLTKRFGDVAAVDGVSLDIRRGEFFSLLGPSGCGKTTLLRMIGGFELPTEGSIRIGGADVTRTPPYRRPVNMVFQQYALFPHLTVGENVAFGMRYRGIARAEEGRRVKDALALVQMSGFEDRHPHQLSGGQRQRVALARALALEPEVLLLDEPLGALDQKLRKEVQMQLKHLQRSLGITFVFVTHDQEEALTMSDRVAVMHRGRVEQMDEASRVFERPATEFVANFMGASNFFEGRVAAVLPDGVRLQLRAGPTATVSTPPGTYREGEEARFVVRPEKLDLREPVAPAGGASLEVTVEDRVYQGVSTLWIVRDSLGGRFTVYEQNAQPFDDRPRFETGGAARLCWDPRHAVMLKTNGERG